MTLFTGAGVALVTPFREDKSVHFEELGRLLEDQIAGGTDAVIICGTTGEPATMKIEERIAVIRYAVEKTAGRIPVIAGTGGNCTEDVIALSQRAQAAGADGLLVVTPFYNKATQNGLYEHYKAVAASVDLPIIMYNVPSRTGCNLLPETAARLGRDIDLIVGVKEASGNISQAAKLIQLSEGNLSVYSGNDDQILPILSLGGAGVISVLSNLVPQDTHDMVIAYLQGDLEKARRLQLKYLDLISALFCEVNPIPVKWALNRMGYRTGGYRLPLTEPAPEHQKLLESELYKAGLIAS